MNKLKNSGLRLKKTTLSALGAGKLAQFGRKFTTIPEDFSCIQGFGVYCAPVLDGERGLKPEMNQDKKSFVSWIPRICV